MNPKRRSPITGVVTAFALVFLFLPLAVVVLFSFHRTASLTLPFTGFSFRWYSTVFSSVEFRSAILNSLVIAVATAAVTLVLGTMAAVGLARSSSRHRGWLTMLFFLPITLPGLFLGIALLSLFDRMDFSLSLTTVGIAHMVYVFPYFLLIALTAVARLDPALEEVAADLGASPARTFWKITLPQIWPVLAGAAALAFMLSLDEFVITFFVIGTDSTLPLFLFSSLRRTVDPSINVISTLLISTLLLLWVVVFALTLREARLRQGRVLAERGAW